MKIICPWDVLELSCTAGEENWPNELKGLLSLEEVKEILKTNLASYLGWATTHGFVTLPELKGEKFNLNIYKGDLRHINFYDVNLSNSSFIACDLRGINFTGSNLSNCRFYYCDLSGVTLHGADIKNCMIVCSRLLGSDLSQLEDLSLIECELEGIDSYGSNIKIYNKS